MIPNSKVNHSDKINLLETKSIWSFKQKIARALWLPFSFVIRIKGPRFLSPVRVCLLRVFGAKIGNRVLVSGEVHIWCPWNLEIGDYSAISFNVEIYNFAKITIGRNTVISQHSYLCTATHDYTAPNLPLIMKPIFIGSQSWVAAKTFVAPGVTIGEGCVIGACSVVTKNIADWNVAAGNPAKIIRTRVINSNTKLI